MIPADQPVFVQWDWIAPLETFWVLYHTERPGVLIRDPWQAADRVRRTTPTPTSSRAARTRPS